MHRGVAGFTLVEAMVVVAILGLMLGIGIPRMADWLAASKATSAAGFYAEGFAQARAQAATHNSASRLVLSRNANNGQLDWQVDVCFPVPGTPCTASSGAWSSTTVPVAPDGLAATGPSGATSLFRSADALANSTMLTLTVTPAGATAVYFTPVGWVAAGGAASVQRIDLAPVRTGAFPASAVALTLSGVASKCDPKAAANDSRGCPQ
jgi:type IV fimbrial biogenesis protein FimT